MNPDFNDVPFQNILKCVHCGLCLNDCPTYGELGTEQDSPRGRLYLMRAIWEGEWPLNEEVAAPLSRCLDCRACETACPSGVPYGELLEKTRGVMEARLPRSLLTKLLRAIFLDRLLMSHRLLKWFSVGGRAFRSLGLHHLGARLPGRLGAAHRLMPHFSGRSFKETIANRKPPPETHMKVGFFSGCVMDVAEEAIHLATWQLLEAMGCKVIAPLEQACCGALHVHSGDRENARRLALRNEKAFEALDVDAIIVNSAGCGAQLKEMHHLFSDTPERDRQRWKAFGAPFTDILQFMAATPQASSLPWSREPTTVFYDAPCHLIHAQKVDNRAFLGQLPGVNLVPLTQADRCCGAGGIYNLIQKDISEAVLGRKMDDIEATLERHPQGTVLLTGNPGCLFQIRRGVEMRALPIKVMHPATWLLERLELCLLDGTQ